MSARETTLLIGVVVAGIGARLYQLGAESLWWDEAASWGFSQLPVHELWSSVPQYELNPPFYYTLLRIWSFVAGNSEFALRLPSAIFGAMTIPVVYLIGRTALRDRREATWAGLSAALIFALHPVQIQFAQNARAYTLLTFACSLVILALVSWLRNPRALECLFQRRAHSDDRRWPYAVMFALGCALALWSHNTAVLLLGSLVGISIVLILVRSSDRSLALRNIVGLGAFALLLWLPGAFWLIKGLNRVQTDFWITRPSIHDFMDVCDYLFGSAGLAQPALNQVFAVAVFGSVAAAGAWRLISRGDWPVAVLLCLGAAFPILVSLGASFLITPIFISRPLIWTQIPAAVLVGIAILWLPDTGWWRSAGAVAVLACLVAGLTAAYPSRQEPWREIVDMIARDSRPDDLIVVWPSFTHLPMRYYKLNERAKGRRATLWFAEPGDNAYPSLRQMLTSKELSTEDVLREIREKEVAGGRVWVVIRVGGKPVSPWNQTTVSMNKYLASVRGAPDNRLATTGPARLLRYPERPDNK
jgi:mannosyltransferase